MTTSFARALPGQHAEIVEAQAAPMPGGVSARTRPADPAPRGTAGDLVNDTTARGVPQPPSGGIGRTPLLSDPTGQPGWLPNVTSTGCPSTTSVT